MANKKTDIIFPGLNLQSSQDSIEVEAAKHYNKERRQSSFCLAKVPLYKSPFSDRKSPNLILKVERSQNQILNFDKGHHLLETAKKTSESDIESFNSPISKVGNSW